MLAAGVRRNILNEVVNLSALRPFLHVIARLRTPLLAVACVLGMLAKAGATQPLALSETERAWIDAHPVVRLGVDPAYPPYSFVDTGGAYSGVSAAFMGRIGDLLGIRFVPVSEFAWPDLVGALQARRIDAIATMVYLPERSAYAGFSEIYLPTPLVVMTDVRHPQLATIAELAKLRVALVKGYSSTVQVMTRYPELQPRFVATPLEGLRALAGGEVDAYIGVLGVNTYLAEKHGMTNLKTNAAFDMQSNGQRVAVRGDWPQLVALIDKALATIPERERADLMRQWMPAHGAQIPVIDYAPLVRRWAPWLAALAVLVAAGALAMALVNRHLQTELARREREWVASEARFRATFEQAAVGIAHVAPDGRWIRVNQRLCDIVGYAHETLLTRTFQDITHADDLDADLALVKRTLAGDIPGYTMEKRYLHCNGHVVWINLTVSLVRRADGSPDYFISVVEDISERKRASDALQDAGAVFRSTREGIIITDRAQRILAVNPAFSEISGYAADEVLGHTPAMLQSGHHSASEYRAMWAQIDAAGHWQGEVLSRRKDGEVFPELLTISTVFDADGAPSRYVAILTDLSRLKRSEAELARLAHYDPLTDLPNRLLVQSRLDHALDRAERDGASLAVMFLDIDRFKDVNDSLGHPVGDELLVAMARRMRSRLRESDTLARLGGDEFLVVLEDVQRPEDAADVAQALIRLQDSPITLPSGHEVYVGVSIGISLYPTDGNTTTELIRQADAAMYQAKSHGRNTFRFYTATLTRAADQRLATEQRLRRALAADEFVLHYQPQIAADSGAVVGCEALVRWRNADGSLIPPGDFIPLAEETGIIVPLGQWVLETACVQAQAWREAGVGELLMAVNLSARQLLQHDLVERIDAVLRQTGLPPACLKLEFTESMIMNKREEGRALIHALKQLGVGLSIDDFGTGYSSLSYLKSFPIDEMKIDRSFVRDTPQNASDAAIVATIVAMARNLGLRVVAEGVETPAQLAFLQGLGCNFCQGFLISRPLAAPEFAAFVRRRAAAPDGGAAGELLLK